MSLRKALLFVLVAVFILVLVLVAIILVLFVSLGFLSELVDALFKLFQSLNYLLGLLDQAFLFLFEFFDLRDDVREPIFEVFNRLSEGILNGFYLFREGFL